MNEQIAGQTENAARSGPAKIEFYRGPLCLSQKPLRIRPTASAQPYLSRLSLLPSVGW